MKKSNRKTEQKQNQILYPHRSPKPKVMNHGEKDSRYSPSPERDSDPFTPPISHREFRDFDEDSTSVSSTDEICTVVSKTESVYKNDMRFDSQNVNLEPSTRFSNKQIKSEIKIPNSASPSSCNLGEKCGPCKRSRDGNQYEQSAGSRLLYTVPNRDREKFPRPKTKYFGQSGNGVSLAYWSEDTQKYVHIYDQDGIKQKEIPIYGKLLHGSWDPAGEKFAMISDNSSEIIVWNSGKKVVSKHDTNLGDTCSSISWKKSGGSIAYGTSKGNYCAFHFSTNQLSRDIGIMDRGIVCIAWSADGRTLALAGCKMLRLLNPPAHPHISISLPGTPSKLRFGYMNPVTANLENAMASVINEGSIFLIKFLEHKSETCEFKFQPDYGLILDYAWNPENILVIFSNGYFISVSTKIGQMGRQLLVSDLNGPIIHCSVSSNQGKMALCFEDKYEIRYTTSPFQICALEYFKCSCIPVNCELKGESCQLLSILTRCGDVEVYLIGAPMLGSCLNDYLIHMISSKRLSIQRFNPNLQKEGSIEFPSQPTSLVAGPKHFAVWFDNTAWFYSFADIIKNRIDKPCCTRKYGRPIQDMILNKSSCVAKWNNKLYLHSILDDENHQKHLCFPMNSSAKVNCFALTDEYLIYVEKDSNSLRVVELGSQKQRETREIFPSDSQINRIVPDSTRLNFMLTTESCEGFIYDLVQDFYHQIPDLPEKFDGVLWECENSQKHAFLTYSQDSLFVHAFIFWQDLTSGAKVQKAGCFKAFDNKDFQPLCLRNSQIYSQTSFGSITKSPAISDYQLEDSDKRCCTVSKLDRCFTAKNYREAATLCETYQIHEFWGKLAEKAVKDFNFDIAIEAYLQQGKVSVALDLQEIMEEEDAELCMGHILMMFRKYKRAERRYLQSSQKEMAVLLNTYLQRWSDAFVLAKKHSPELVCQISIEYALSEERRGNFIHALQLFEEFLRHIDKYSCDPGLIEECEAGLARNCIRCEQVDRGLELVKNLTEAEHVSGCAEVLISKQYYDKAVDLFSASDDWDKMASMYILQKEWRNFELLFSQITSPDVFRQYALAKELEGDLKAAAFAHLQLGDKTNACRLYLKANEPDEAIRLSKSTHDSQCIKLICNYFLEREDPGTAIRFLVKMNLTFEAITIAITSNRIELFVSTLLENSPKLTRPQVKENYRWSLEEIARYYNGIGKWVQAARYFLLCDNPIDAFGSLVDQVRYGQISNETEFMTLMIETRKWLGNCQSVVDEFILDYYLGRLDGRVKDPRFILKIAMNIEAYEVAAEAAIKIAKTEQIRGNYIRAHCTLLLVCMEMRFQGKKIPKANMQALELVHVYLLSNIHICRGNTRIAGRLLARLSKHVDKFPAHIIHILSNTIIQCMKIGLKESGMAACFKIMGPEYRPRIDVKHKSKFELTLRKFSKTQLTDVKDDASPCPFCTTMVPNFELFCDKCSTLIPFCIATGRHVTKADLTCCPHCKFPAIRSEFIRYLNEETSRLEPVCPMCDAILNPRDLLPIRNADKYLLASVTREDFSQDIVESEKGNSLFIDPCQYASDTGEGDWDTDNLASTRRECDSSSETDISDSDQ